jgi:hypothetical protein
MKLRVLKGNEVPAVTIADKGNEIVILDIANYSWKRPVLLNARAHWKLKKDPTETVDCRTGFLSEKSSNSEEGVHQFRQQCSRLPKAYMLPEFQNQGSLFKPIVHTNAVPT